MRIGEGKIARMVNWESLQVTAAAKSPVSTEPCAQFDGGRFIFSSGKRHPPGAGMKGRIRAALTTGKTQVSKEKAEHKTINADATKTNLSQKTSLTCFHQHFADKYLSWRNCCDQSADVPGQKCVPPQLDLDIGLEAWMPRHYCTCWTSSQ